MKLTDLLNLHKASKYGKTKHYTTIQVQTKHGTHSRRVLVGSEKTESGKMKALISIADLFIGKYTEKSLIIKGETYKNVEILRELKQQLGTGTWLKKQKGWVFPSKHKDAVFGFLIEKLEKDIQKQVDSGAETDKTEETKSEIDKLKEIQKPRRKEPETDDKKISEAINNTTEATRLNTANTLYGDLKEDEHTAFKYSFEPSETDFTFDRHYLETDRQGNVITQGKEYTVKSKDYTGVKSIDIEIISDKEILDKERPSYIPDIDERMFSTLRSQGYSGLQFAKLDEDKYIISNTKYAEQISTFNYENNYSESTQIKEAINKYHNTFTIVNRDVLAATVDYYDRKRKAEHDLKYKIKLDDYFNRMRDKYDINADIDISTPKKLSDAIFESKGLRYRFKFPTKERLNKKHKITQDRYGNPISVANKSHFNLMQAVDKNLTTKDTWDVYRNTLEEINITIGDLKVQSEMAGIYAKGKETSYGESGTVNDLLESHGVKVKRQDGSDVLPEHIEDVKNALTKVYSVFGDRSSIAQRTNLKISHSGEKRMHASKAVGIYTPRFNTIGVTAKLGLQQFGFTLSHEFAHFADHQLGKRIDKHYVSDNPKHIANKIASTFRSNMKERSTSQYTNRTCECFARAMEQYFAEKTGGGAYYDDKDIKDYPNPNVFNKEVSPLIDQFLKENDHLLKSLRLTVVETFMELEND